MNSAEMFIRLQVAESVLAESAESRCILASMDIREHAATSAEGWWTDIECSPS